jgi:CubicO group peptidase (beta-lactamase class C family)
MMRWLVCLIVCFCAVETTAADSPALQPLVETIEKEIKDGRLVGAQVALGNRDGIVESRSLGTRGPGDNTAIDRDTRFCIGSTSKPLASACILKLAADKKLSLDEPIDKWIPAFKSPRLADGGTAKRAPTLREILAHRGGIYSQTAKLDEQQTRFIRDWRLSLEMSVDGIAGEKLIAEPGEKHAYSGAGYCVAGRVAEIAAGKAFNGILRDVLGNPLGMARTGYFVDKGEANVAVGGLRQAGGVIPHPVSPHLIGEEHRLALVGGSIYSTANEMSAFARLVVNQGRAGDKVVLPAETAVEFIKPQYKDQRYGLGWILTTTATGDVTELWHNGSLAAYRAVMLIDWKHGSYIVVLMAIVAGNDEADNFNRKMEQSARKALTDYIAKSKK